MLDRQLENVEMAEQDAARLVVRSNTESGSRPEWWIFQANPEHYAIEDALKGLSVLKWTVNRYADKIKPGDRAYIWKSGPTGGILAEATILDKPREMSEAPQELSFYLKQNSIVQIACRATLRIDKVFDKPAVTRSQMKAHKILKEMLIIRQPNGTNFPVTEDEQLAIAEVINGASSGSGQSDRGDEGLASRDLRAYRAWAALTRAATERQVITYGQLADAIGIYHRAVRFTLGVIQDHCLNEKLPPLTILVVNQQTGLPGVGFIAWDADDIESGVRSVYGFNWTKLENPFVFAADGTSEDDIVNELVENPTQAEHVYARVKVRGVAQSIFRRVMLQIYEQRCAFCGLNYAEALEAAHIVPWRHAEPKQRLDPTNGLLLCSTHHRLFDSGRMGISIDFKIIWNSRKDEENSSSAVLAISIALNGNMALLPAHSKHRPLAEWIRQRNDILSKK